MLTNSLVKLLDMKRILRMRPKPRDLDTLDPRARVRGIKSLRVKATQNFIEYPGDAQPKESLSQPGPTPPPAHGEGEEGTASK